MSYNELSEELKNTIAEAKKVPKGSLKFVLLRIKATKLHTELIKVEKMITNFK